MYNLTGFLIVHALFRYLSEFPLLQIWHSNIKFDLIFKINYQMQLGGGVTFIRKVMEFSKKKQER